VTLSNLAKYLMIRSVARSLCDSWAICSLRSPGTLVFQIKFRTLGHRLTQLWGFLTRRGWIKTAKTQIFG